MPATTSASTRHLNRISTPSPERCPAGAGARSPVSFFASPGRPSSPVPPGCEVHVLADGTDDVAGALAALADLAAPDAKPAAQQPAHQAIPDGELTAETAAAVIGALLPEGAIVCDEANTSGLWLPASTAGAPPHDWLTPTGRAFRQCLPPPAGPALACPGRRALVLGANGTRIDPSSTPWARPSERHPS